MYIVIYICFIYIYIYIWTNIYICQIFLETTDLGGIEQKLTSMFMCHVLGDILTMSLFLMERLLISKCVCFVFYFVIFPVIFSLKTITCSMNVYKKWFKLTCHYRVAN